MADGLYFSTGQTLALEVNIQKELYIVWLINLFFYPEHLKSSQHLFSALIIQLIQMETASKTWNSAEDKWEKSTGI